MIYILIGIILAFYLGFAAYVSYDTKQMEKQQARNFAEKI